MSGSPAVTEILFALNLKDRIVGVTEYCNWPEEAKKIVKVGKERFNAEKLLKLQPDLVIVQLEDYKQELDKLRNMKFTVTSSNETKEATLEVFAISPKSLSDVLEMIGVIGTITNKEHSAYSLTQRMRRRIEWVEARAAKEKKLKVLVVTSKRPLTVAGEGTCLSDLAKAAGFINVAPRGKDPFPKMKRDQIEKANPDIIITSNDIARNPKDIYNNRNFRKTGACKNKRAVCIDKDILLRSGPRLTEALEEIASSAYGWPRPGHEGEGEEIEQTKE